MSKEITNFVPKELPSLSDLHHDPDLAFKNDQFALLMHQPVNHKWVKKHPLVKVKNLQGQYVPLEYIPVDKVKLLLTRIFGAWKCEVIDYKVLFQSVGVHVRLHWQHPLTGIWSFNDGVGAVGVQTDKGESASNLGAIKLDAVMKALPAAESYALKDAAEKFGPLFGADLNHFDAGRFKPTYTQQNKAPESPAATQTDLPVGAGEGEDIPYADQEEDLKQAEKSGWHHPVEDPGEDFQL